MSALADTLNEHVTAVAADHGVKIIIKPGAHARAYRKANPPRIVMRPVRGRVTYFIALHELGHIIGPNPRLRLEQEVAAWRWALANAIVEPTGSVWRHIASCLRAYIARAHNWASMKLPDPDHDFWALLTQADQEGAS